MPDPSISPHTPTPPIRSHSRPRLAVGVTLLAGAWMALLVPRYQTLIDVVLIGGLGLTIYLCRPSGRSPLPLLTLAAVAAAVAALFHLLFLGIPTWYTGWAVAEVVTILAAGLCMAPGWGAVRDQTRRWSPPARIATRTIGVLTALVVAVVSVVVAVTAITPVPLVKAGQSVAGVRQSFEPEGQPGRQDVLGDGIVRTSDIAYATMFPNSFLDIYTPADGSGAQRPTYVYVHGGGWVGGGKATGDPAAGSTEGFEPTFGPALRAGYNFVSIGYAFSTDHPYPTPLLQLSQAVAFLQEHEAKYGIDMDRVVLGGGSAGGQITGQFANLQTDPAYAAQVGIAPVMTGNLKALALDSPALDMRRVGRTEAPVLALDFAFGMCVRAYLGNDARLEDQADVINHVTTKFPPTFISDGNTGTFTDQAQDLHQRLDSLGVLNEINIPPLDRAAVGHAFQVISSKWTDDYNARKYAFFAIVLN